mmetsp:Transcript_68935/g.109389  ORF Transcript_68935/g.109389 Transcript_68935/m.109389 type:complete len:454 (-) Transcript_68935:120-1481(-)
MPNLACHGLLELPVPRRADGSSASSKQKVTPKAAEVVACSGFMGSEGVLSPLHYDASGSGSRGTSCKLFVGGVSAHTTTEALRLHFSKYGRIIDAVVMQKNGRPRGFGFVTFDHPMSAECVLVEQQWLDGRLVDVKRAVPGERAQERASNKIFVGGLAQDVSTEELRAYFSSYGTVADAVVMVDRRTHRSRGFGFVRFSNGTHGNAASEAVLMDFGNHHLAGKWVEVKRATPASQLQDLFPCDGLDDEIYCGMTADDILAAATMGMSLPDYMGFIGWDSSPYGDSTPMSLPGMDVSSGVSARSHARGRRSRRRKSAQKSGASVDLEDASDDGSSPMSTSGTPSSEVAFVSTASVGASSPSASMAGGQNELRALGPITVTAVGGSRDKPSRSNPTKKSVAKNGGVPTASENDPSRANTSIPADQPMKVIGCRDDCFTREDFLSLEVRRPWVSSW